ncbi:hypothetical protein ACN3XK_31230 [Actinomadura welshii]
MVAAARSGRSPTGTRSCPRGGTFARLQITPDLVPSHIVGTRMTRRCGDTGRRAVGRGGPSRAGGIDWTGRPVGSVGGSVPGGAPAVTPPAVVERAAFPTGPP